MRNFPGWRCWSMARFTACRRSGYGPLHRMQKVRLSLHLIEGHLLAAPQERLGIAAGCIYHVEVVQGEEAPSARHKLLG